MDVVKKVTLYMVSQLREVDVKRFMYMTYLVDRELYYLCGFTLFPWKFTINGLRSFEVYNVVDELVDTGYVDKVVNDTVIYRLRREDVKVDVPKQIKDVVDKVIEKTRDVKDLEEHVIKLIDPKIVEIAGLVK